MASINHLAHELLFMVGDHVAAFDDPADRERGLYSLALVSRHFHPVFNAALYKYDARNRGEAMSWGAFFGSVPTVAKARAAGAQFDLNTTHPAVSRALGNHGLTHQLCSVLAIAGGRHNVLDWLQTQDIAVNRITWAQAPFSPVAHIQPGKSAWWPMYWAILYNHEHIVQYLLDRGASPILSVKGRVTAMHVAAAVGREAMFDRLLSLPACGLGAKDEAGNTALHYAAGGFFNVQHEESLGNSPPRLADASSIASLVNRGADIKAFNNEGESPVAFALSTGRSQWNAALQLLDLQPAGFVPDDKLIATALAGASGKPNAVQILLLGRILTPGSLDRLYHFPGIALDTGLFHHWSRDATTPLIWFIIHRCSLFAAQKGEAKAMEGLFMELLRRGASPGGTDSRTRTPLHACIFAALHRVDNRYIMFHKLTKHGLPKAATKYPFNLIDILLRRGASLDAQDYAGMTPLGYAYGIGPGAQDPRAFRMHARDVARLVLLQAAGATGGFTCPSERIKTGLVRRMGVEVLAPEDPLKATLEGEGV